MNVKTTTAIEITYVFDDGRRAPMGSGTIDAQGYIEIDNPATGQEAYITGEISELNARDYVILKEPPTDPDLPQFAISKRKIYRATPEFLSALKDYGMRVYAMEFAFDETAIQPAPPPADDPVSAGELAPEPEPDTDAIGFGAEEEPIEPVAPS